MKIDLELKFNGRRIRPNEFAKVVGDSLKRQAVNSIREKMVHAVCPVHGQPPRKEGKDRLTFCCERLREIALERTR